MTEDDLSCQERQSNELEILQAMYNDDIVDLHKEDSKAVYRPIEFLLNLKPQNGMSDHKDCISQLSLRVKFPPKYPYCCPELKIENSKGISSDDVAKLHNELKSFCKASVGEVMMLEIAQLTQEFLHNHTVPTYKSAYEEMVQNKQKQLDKEAKLEEKRQEIRKRKEELQRREIEEELARRDEEEKKIRKMIKDERENAMPTVQRSSDSVGSLDLSDMPDGVVAMQFNKKTSKSVLKGQLLGSGSNGSVVYIGMDSSTGQMSAIHHWNIALPTHSSIVTLAERNKIDKYLKMISTVEQELQAFVKLSHPNLVSFLGINSSQTQKSIEVNILQEYIPGISMQLKVSNKEKVALDVLRNYAEQMLSGLDYLHSKSVVHKQFKASSVFLDSKGVVKLADFSIGKRLADLYRESHLSHLEVRFTDDRIPSRISKKNDVLRLGIVVLSLAQGQEIKDYPPDLPSNFPPVFQDFLNSCLLVEDRNRQSACELLQHEFIKPSPMTLLAEADEAAAEASQSDDEAKDDLLKAVLENQSRAIQISRLHSEFEELQWLGKGGYGDVVKVRNKLDDRHYAIKRIVLKPSQSEFNKKITREVKLLSRLNHENVVRYYNSWIETIQSNQDDSTSNSSDPITTTTESPRNPIISVNSLGFSDNIEKFAPPAVHSSVSDWSVSLEEVSRHGDMDEDDDDEDMFKTIYLTKEDSSDSILFDGSGDESDQSSDDLNTTATTTAITSSTTMISETDSSIKPIITKRFLYIQMEYCERSTLRDTIDQGLCNDQDRMWRLFREILEGLSHVHQQGMIHRDLKPQNIFLDRNDHVKIGDFGLATSRTKVISSDYLDETSSRSEAGDSTYTGVVGTGLYVAPELFKSSKRTLYSQKVDIYSLGIIFFEMFYSGISTKMERVKVLSSLRMPSITFPSEFDEALLEKEAHITRWCLDHEPSKRPTASELLKCRLVPTPVLEESDVLEAVREMLVDPHSKQHRLMMDEVFNQPIKPITSVVYDYELYKRHFSISSTVHQQRTFDLVSTVMERHGALRVNTPLLLPQIESETSPEAATFMDTSGTVVTLPYNLRVPFARFVAGNNISDLKRYAIEKVFRSRKVRGSRPREIWECTFDIVTSTLGGLIPDAEVISIVSEIISNFPQLSSRKYSLRINHMMALKAVLQHCGLEEDQHAVALAALASSDHLSKSQIDTCLSSLPINHKQMSSLISLTQIQGPLSKLQTGMKGITKSKHSIASSWARVALHDLETLKKNLEILEVSFPIVFDLGFSLKHHQHYNGIIFQISAEIQKKRRTALDILAIGGRYDHLLENLAYMKYGSGLLNKDTQDGKSPDSHVVGVSIAIDKIVTATSSAKESENISSDVIDTCTPVTSSTSRHEAPVDVVVCAMGHSSLLQQRLQVVKSLWWAGIKAETVYDRDPSLLIQDVQDREQQRGVSHLVVISEKDKQTVAVRSLSRDQGKVVENKLLFEQLVAFLKRQTQVAEDGNTSFKKPTPVLATGDSPHVVQPSNHVGTRHLSIEILPPDKLPFNTRKRHEYEIGLKLSNLPVVENISSKATMCVIAVDLPSPSMKQMCCNFDVSHGEEKFNSSVAHQLQSISKYKKYMSAISEKIYEVKFDRKIVMIMLYSYKDDGYFMLV